MRYALTLCLLLSRLAPRSTRIDTLCPYATRFRSRAPIPNPLSVMALPFHDPPIGWAYLSHSMGGRSPRHLFALFCLLRSEEPRLNPVTNAPLVCRLLLEKK